MAVTNSGFYEWVQMLTVASDAARREAARLTAEMNGPFSQSGRLARSGEFWEGPFAEHLRQFIRMVDGYLVSVAGDLYRFAARMESVATEAQAAANAELLGIPSPAADPRAAVAEWRLWPEWTAPSWCPPPGGGGRSGYVLVYLDRSREFGRLLVVGAGEVRCARRRLTEAITPLGLDAPPGLEPLARVAEETGFEVERRVRALEDADRQAAGAFDVAAGLLRLPAALADQLAFDPADPAGSVIRTLVPTAPGLDLGPGDQPTQAKEADPVSVSTGNFWYETTDLAMPGRGLPTVVTRTYNSSRSHVDGPFGYGWSHNLDVRLRLEDSAAVVTLSDGREERHALDAAATPTAPPGATGRLQIDADGALFLTTDGVIFQFDAAGRLTTLRDRSGNETRLECDADGGLTGMRDATGRETVFEGDDHGRICAIEDCLGGRFLYIYDASGDLVEFTDAAGGTWRYAYDDEHHLVAVVDPEGRTLVTNTFDDSGRVIEQADGAGHRWRYRYQPGVTVVTDPLMESVVYEHDIRFRTISVADAVGAKTRFEWNRDDRLVAVTDPSGGPVALDYDQRGCLARVSAPGEAPLSFSWDDNANLLAVEAGGHRTTFSYDDTGRPATLTTAAGTLTQIRWRADGLPEAVIEGDDGVTGFSYDDGGHLAAITDPMGATTSVTFDAAGRPLRETHPGGASTEFAWDPLGRLLSVTDASGHTTTFAYDRSGRLVSLTDPLARTTRSTYDERGLLASVTDPLGRTITFRYDPCGRLERRTDPTGAEVWFASDPTGRLVGVEADGVDPTRFEWDPAGHLISLTDGTGTTAFAYDAAGRPTAERHDRTGVELLHTYDNLGRRRRLELRRAGEPVAVWEHDYDPDGRVVAVVDPTGGRARLTYDPAGRLATVEHANGVVDRWTYDLAGQPAALRVGQAGGEPICDWRFTHDADGNRTAATRNFAGTTTEYTWRCDPLGRLVGVQSGGEDMAFEWDAAGNPTSVGGSAAEYDGADQILALGTETFQHDAAGDLVGISRAGSDTAVSLRYDALGRLVELHDGEDMVTWMYDGFGRRVSRADAAGATRRVYDGVSVIAEFRDDGQLDLETTAGLVVLARHNRGCTRHLHPDATTSIAEVTAEDGELVARYAYTPFGERRVVHGDPDSAGPFGFCGLLGVREAAGGFLDMRARFYHPGLGRFTSPDPWPPYHPEPVTLNRYLYALGDPVSQVDPYGLFCWTGKSHGKCRGLHDVVERVGGAIETAANAVAPGLSFASAVYAGVAAVSTGLTFFCPPCGVVTVPLAGFAAGTSFYLGLAATATRCIGVGLHLTNFDCASAVAFTSVGLAGRYVGEAAVAVFGKDLKELALLRRTFPIFLKATSKAVPKAHK